MAKSCEDKFDSFIFPTEFPFEFDSNSSLNSPVGSAASTETESSDEVHITHCFTQFSLNDQRNHNLKAFTSSHAACNANHNIQKTWELVYAAEVSRKARQSMQSTNNVLVLGQSYTNQRREEMLKNQLLAMYERECKLQQLRQHILDRERFKTLQIQNQRKLQQISAMRAGFDGFQVKKKCAGTGVFLPRTYKYPSQAPKRSDFSTALLPAKAVQAQLHVQPHPWFKGGQTSNHGSMVGHRNEMLMQRRQILGANEMRLPQEWTY